MVHPFAEQCGFAKARRGADESEFSVQPRVQPLNQAQARDQFWPDRGDIELSFQKGGGHLFRSWRATSHTMLIISCPDQGATET
jgi:hypothetical protein